MARIGATISGLEQYFLTHLARVDEASLESAIRISTGKETNRPADDPAAFFQIGQFEQRLSEIQETREQVDIAASVGAQSQFVVDEVRSQLETIRAALELDESGGLSTSERTEQQAAIDSAIESIDDLTKTEINGRRYLDGSVNYRFSGKNSSQIERVEVFAHNETSFSGTVTSAATQAQVTYTGAVGAITANADFTLTGKRGSASFSVTSGQSLTAVEDLINQSSHETGVVAVAAGDSLTFTTVDFGDAATIDIDVSSGSFNTAGTTQGTDAVVTINGQAIDSSLVDGNLVRYASNGSHVGFEFVAGFSGAFDPVTVLDEDVSKFVLSPDLNDVTNFGVSGIGSLMLGGVSGRVRDLLSGGSLDGLGDNTSHALRVVDEALSGLTRVEGTVDAFADVAVASAASILGTLETETSDTISTINGVNEEAESLLLSKNQSLGANVISSISILQQQQLSVLALVQQLAGI